MKYVLKKGFFIFLFVAALLQSSIILPTQLSGNIDSIVEISPGYSFYGHAFWCAESKQYSEGGISFTWPSGFTQAPTVLASVSSPTYSLSGQVVPIVVDNSVNGCTVYVNIGTMSAVGEGGDSFTVHIFAIQPNEN